jgi:YVTN family beta-propeller protein
LPQAPPTAHHLAAISLVDHKVRVYNVKDDHIWSGGITAIAVGDAPVEMCTDAAAKRLYFTEKSSPSVVVIDLAEKAVTARMTDRAMKRPDGCMVSPDAEKLYLMDLAADDVFIFSTKTNQLLSQVSTGHEPRRAIFTPDGKRVLVSVENAEELTVLDAVTDKIISHEKTVQSPRCLAVTPDGKYIVTCLIDDDALGYYKADTLEFDQEMGVTRSPQVVDISPDGQILYSLGHAWEGVLGIISLRPIGEERRVANQITIGGQAARMTISDDGKFLYIGSENGIGLFDTRLMKLLYNEPGAPYGMAPGVGDVIFLK